MKKSILTSLTALAISTAQAGFIMKIPLEQTQGGALPDGSINMTPRTPGLPVENWQPAEPLYGEWVNNGAVYGCSNWAPDPSTQTIDVTFDQTATDCKQDQTTTKQDREQETTTLEYRNVGLPVPANHTISVNSSRTATGTASCLYNNSSSGIFSEKVNSYWYASAIQNFLLVVVNGEIIKHQTDYTSTSITVKGVIYKRGASIKDSYYEVCK